MQIVIQNYFFVICRDDSLNLDLILFKQKERFQIQKFVNLSKYSKTIPLALNLYLLLFHFNPMFILSPDCSQCKIRLLEVKAFTEVCVSLSFVLLMCVL